MSKMWKYIACVVLLALASATSAQSQPVVSNRAIALSTQNGLSMAEVTLPSPSQFVDFVANEATRYARIDEIGLLRFVPRGAGEGVYTFSPFVDGFGAPSALENRLRVRQGQWSPNGEMVAFLIANDISPEISDGVWFWQPAREIPTDPSYQLVRNCPPTCVLPNNDPARQWRAIDLAWSPDNASILVTLDLLLEDRRALHVAFAARDPNNTQANNPPVPIRYEYGHWTAGGQRIVVSGRDAQERVVFGTISRDGSSSLITQASTIGLAWAQNAVQNADGTFYLLGSTEGQGRPVQLFDGTGQALTDLIGTGAPTDVAWSPDYSAVRIVSAGRTYIALIDGTVYDITVEVGGTPNIDWVTGGLPRGARLLDTPAPIASATAVEAAGEDAPATEAEIYSVGDLMRIVLDDVPIYTEPAADAAQLGTLRRGTELIITSDRVVGTSRIWWRVQTLEYSGWIEQILNGQPTIQPVQD